MDKLFRGKHHQASYSIDTKNREVDYYIHEIGRSPYTFSSKKHITGQQEPNRILRWFHKFSKKGFWPLAVYFIFVFIMTTMNPNSLLWGIQTVVLMFSGIPMAFTKFGAPEWEYMTVNEAAKYAVEEVRRFDREKDQIEYEAEVTKIQLQGMLQQEREEQKILRQIERELLA